MHIKLRHNTTYRYEHAVILGPHDIRLRPSAHGRTPILDFALRVEPAGGPVHWYTDAAGNSVARALFSEPVAELRFDVELAADLTPRNPFDFLLDLWATQFPFRYPAELAAELAPALGADDAPAMVGEWVQREQQDLLGAGSIDSVQLLIELTRRVRRDVSYTVREEAGVQAPEETLALAVGSCRDSSWLLIQVARQLGLAARFVSGYLIQPASSASSSQDSSAPAQAMSADLHAWAEVYLPGGGWIGLDPTSGLLTTEGHIPLAVARIPSRAAPVTGSASPSESRLTHRLEVEAA